MSKKKATMTLKDFHGGSIPSDLRLPSAPGVTVRPIDRPGFDRQMSWGNSAGKPDHQTRPVSAGSSRNIDEKTPFFSHSLHIGRNFDEDERKPLYGISGPRRTIGEPVEHTKVDNLSSTGSGIRASSIPLSQNGSVASSYAGRVSEIHSHSRLNNQTYSGNAWGIRKESSGVKELAVSWSAPDAETKLAHASALEKVSSGRWNSKQHVHSPKDIEGKFGYNSKKESDDSCERGTYVNSANELQPLHYHTGKSSGPEASQRPKLKILPRSKPVENLESPTDYKKTSNHLHVEDSYVVHEMKTLPQADSVGTVAADRAIERPKLNLKPRSQSTEQLDGNIESKRGTVFGGARPRELVLKERGVEDDVSSYNSPRVKQNLPNEIRRNNNSQQERPPSPDTWHKTNDAARYGKAASAVELAHTFSKSVSKDLTTADRFLGSKGVQSRGQVPFSRLTGPAPRPQINGY